MDNNVIVLHKPTHSGVKEDYEPRMAALFLNVVKAGEKQVSLELGEELEGYLVFTLVRNMRRNDLFSLTIGAELIHATTLYTGKKKEDTLNKIGDTSLVLAGFFPERARSLHVSSNYFCDIGEIAFSSLAESLEHRKCFALAKLYQRVAEKFSALADVLKATRKDATCLEALSLCLA